MYKKIFFIPLFVLFFASCTTIEINEEDVFDIKRTIHPEALSNSAYQAEEIRIPTTSDIFLEAWYIQQPGARNTVLYFGGNGFIMETARQIIYSILEQEVNLLVFNYRGYGINPGNPSVEGLKRDGLAIYDYLINEKNIDPQRLILHGHSMGSFIATYVSNNRKTRSLVLESPITDLNDWTKTAIPWFLKPFIHFKFDSALVQNSNLEQIKQVSSPLLILTGKQDKITPPELSHKLFATATVRNKQLLIIDDGGHNDLPMKATYHTAIRNFYHTHPKE